MSYSGKIYNSLRFASSGSKSTLPSNEEGQYTLGQVLKLKTSELVRVEEYTGAGHYCVTFYQMGDPANVFNGAYEEIHYEDIEECVGRGAVPSYYLNELSN